MMTMELCGSTSYDMWWPIVTKVQWFGTHECIHMSHTCHTCHMSYVTCHMSHVTCHMSHVPVSWTINRLDSGARADSFV